MPLVTDATGNNLTYKIIGLAMAVHNEIGYGFKEEVYEKALAIKLEQAGIEPNREEVYEKALAIKLEQAGIEPNRQRQVNVEFHGQAAATFYLDLFPDEQVVVEVKALSHSLTNDELAQVINYLKATGAPVGLLFNFGRRKLEFRRIFPAKDMKPAQRLGRDNVIRPKK